MKTAVIGVMPDHKSHELFGIAIWLVLLVFLVLSYPNDMMTVAEAGAVGFVFCFLGSILPDIDEKHSRIFKNVRFFLFMIVFVVSYAGLVSRYPTGTLAEMLYVLALCVLIATAAVMFFYAIVPAHRKGIHSVAAGFVYGAFALVCSHVIIDNLWLAFMTAFFSFLAYISHLILDRSLK